MQKEQIMKRVHKIIAGTAGTLALVAADSLLRRNRGSARAVAPAAQGPATARWA
jgi:hypothetical protein